MGARMTDKAKARRVTLAEPDGLAWFWAMGEANIHYGGEVIDIGARWDELTDAAIRYADAFQPPVLEHHDRSSRPLGVVRRMRVLTSEEAATLGITQEHPRALYLGVDLNEEGRAADERGQLIYGSLGFDLDYTDERGEVWPMAIKEFSCVTVPHLKAGQVQRPALRSIQLSESQGGNMDNEEKIAEGAAVEEVEMQEGEPTLADLMSAIGALAAQVADLAAMMPKPEAEAEVEMACGADAEMSELRAKVATLNAKLVERDADEAVRKLGEARIVNAEQAKRARSLFLRDAEAFNMLVESLPERPTAEARAAGKAQTKAITLAERANQIVAAKGIKFSEATAEALAEGYKPGGA